MIIFVTPDTGSVSHLTLACGFGEADFAHVIPSDAQPTALWEVLETTDVDAVVIGPDVELEPATPLMRDIDARFPLVSIIVFTEDSTSAMRAALRAGAADVLTEGAPEEEVVETLRRASERGQLRRAATAPVPESVPTGEIITVASPRGGVGRTLVATSVAALLERSAPGEVVLVDLDLQSGDIAPLLALTPELSLGSIASRGVEFDSADLKTVLTKTEAGLHVLAGPESLTSAVKIGAETVTATLNLLKESFRYVVVDNGAAVSDEMLAVLDVADHLLLICAPDVPSVRALGRMADALDELRIHAPVRHLVLNRASERYGMPARDIEAVIGLETAAAIPASKEIAMTVNLGEPFAELLQPRGPIARGLKPLVAALAPESVKQRSGRSLLGRAR